MCGIAGFINLPGSSQKLDSLIKQMTDSLAHRGPDGEGFFSDKTLRFGHRRLAIIDLTTGDQPLSVTNGRYWITFNGEIYNYLELRRQLQKEGYIFKTTSDTEVLLNLYCKYKEKCLHKLNGMFAFCIYDRRTKTLFAARDRLGIKPFYYYQRGKQFVFASEIKAILQVKPNLAKLNKQALAEYLTFQFCLDNKTLFKGIKKLLPGHYLLYKNGKLTLKRYWHLDYHLDEKHDEEYFTKKLAFLLEDSVKLRMRSDVPVGAHLSGGTDSSLVSSLASRLVPQSISTFTGAFKETGFTEVPYATQVSQSIHAKSYVIYIKPQDFIQTIQKLIYHMDEPAGGPGLFPQYFVSKLAGRHVKVVLGGQGGDEIFGGYIRYLIAYLEFCLKGVIFGSQKRADPRFIVTFESIRKSLPMVKPYLPLLQSFWAEGLFSKPAHRYFRLIDRSHGVSELVNQDYLPRNNRQLKRAFNQIFEAPGLGSFFNKMTFFDLKTLLPALLHVEDRMSMAASVESRTPLLDHRIIELVSQMPPGIKFKDGQPKYILKQAIKGKIPSSILRRKDKMGFPVPLSQWSQKELKPFLKDILLGKTTRDRGLFKMSGVEKILNQPRPFDRRLWGLLNLELWFREFIDQ